MEAFLFWDDCLEWDTVIWLFNTALKFDEFADNVEVVAFVTLEAVLEWLIFNVADLDVGGLVLGVREQQIPDGSFGENFPWSSLGSSKGSGNSDNSSMVEYTSEYTESSAEDNLLCLWHCWNCLNWGSNENDEVRDTAAEEYPELGVEIIVLTPGEETGGGIPE